MNDNQRLEEIFERTRKQERENEERIQAYWKKFPESMEKLHQTVDKNGKKEG